MAKLTWDNSGERFYETGVDRGVLYPFAKSGADKYAAGVAWDGLITVTETPSGAEPTALYADNIKYLNLMSVEELGLTIGAYKTPDEFDECDGISTLATGVSVGQQERNHFGFCYRTLIGNDTDGNNHGYKLHLVYDCLATPSEKSYSSVNDSPEAMQLSYDVSTTPVPAGSNLKPTASITIDSTKIAAAALTAIETALYGDTNAAPTLPLPEELLRIINGAG